MVTNIDLTAGDDVSSEHKFGSKSTLFLAVGLIVVVVLAQLGLNYFKNSYVNKQQQAQATLVSKKAAVSGAAYADLVDFQERLEFLDSASNSRTDWDVFLKEFSQYVIPEVKLNDLTYDPKADELSFSATAPDINTAAREIVLLKKFPQTDSIEFSGASEELNNADGTKKTAFSVKIKLKASSQKTQ
ncbi:MAG: hypothetical protein WC858_05450 [Parcubacteria group bacterium]|jgi:Tfp pilus assembly protein PilN